MKKILISLFVFTIISCSTQDKFDIIEYYEVSNQHLLKNIKECISLNKSYREKYDGIIQILVRQRNNAAEYLIQYSFDDSFCLEMYPPTVITIIESELVYFHYCGQQFYRLKEDYRNQIIEEYFPKEHEFYQRNEPNAVYFPANIDMAYSIFLRFENDIIVHKEIFRDAYNICTFD